MKKKIVYRICVLFLFIFIPYKAQAAATLDDVIKAINDQGTTIRQKIDNLKQDLIAYFAGTKVKENKAEAELLYEKSPGTKVDPQKISVDKVGNKIAEVNNSIEQQGFIRKKEINDFEYGLYMQNFWGEEKRPAITDPRTHIVTEHFGDPKTTGFCSSLANGTGIGILKQNLLCPNPNNNLMFLDLNIGTLLDKQTLAGSDQNFAALAIRNLVNPIPSDELKKAIADDPKLLRKETRQKAADVLGSMAILSPAYYSLNHMYEMRKAIPITKNGQPGQQENKSMLSIIDEEANRRFKNPDWYKKVDEASTDALLREMVQMEAFKMWMDYQKYLQNERIEALLASLVSSNNQSARVYSEVMSMSSPAAAKEAQEASE